ncbi:MAG: hypothetical protein JWR26_2681 [Pedosphaera sp.]|nr:hypothetical protein [Pedosphaera sp.]
MLKIQTQPEHYGLFMHDFCKKLGIFCEKFRKCILCCFGYFFDHTRYNW